MDENKHYLEIDLIKAFAIVSVIILHSVPSSITASTISFFTMEQAVPVFLLIMGLNGTMSFKRRGFTSLNQMYSWNHFQRRLKRLLIPFLIIFFVSIMLGLLLNETLYFGVLTFIGFLPLTGPGNYFISISFQFIFIFPLLYLIYKHSPMVLLVLTFILSFVFELAAHQIPIFGTDSYVYKACILRYIFVIALGMYAVDKLNTHNLNFLIKNKLFWIGLVVSVSYMLLVSVFGWKISYFNSSWQPQIFLSFFYTLFLCALGLRYLPSISTKFSRNIALIGKASYHIFLVQIILFGAGLTITPLIIKLGLKDHYSLVILGPLVLLGNIIICVGIGVLFYLLEKKVLT
jgi:peptidoglycan/LPS O-acetylase OafA/YrhL